ncbi:hypothetical protein ABHN11_24725 [Brevibacillus centrosporus]|uniref:hypothetical protein n=1 Tax=Brevibacillus centrosporus TaxID=54910 RepID=UPI003D24C16F
MKEDQFDIDQLQKELDDWDAKVDEAFWQVFNNPTLENKDKYDKLNEQRKAFNKNAVELIKASVKEEVARERRGNQA